MGPRESACEPTEHVSFAEAIVALEDALALTIPDRTREEERMVTMGQDSDGRLIVVARVPRETGGRILSARRATPREQRSYEEKP